EDLHVVAGTAADVDGVAGRIERDADEAVGDRDRLFQRPGRDVDDVKRTRGKVAAGDDGEKSAVRADHHAERAIVRFNMRAGRSQRLSVRYENVAALLHTDHTMTYGKDRRSDPKHDDQRRDRHAIEQARAHDVLLLERERSVHKPKQGGLEM